MTVDITIDRPASITLTRVYILYHPNLKGWYHSKYGLYHHTEVRVKVDNDIATEMDDITLNRVDITLDRVDIAIERAGISITLEIGI